MSDSDVSHAPSAAAFATARTRALARLADRFRAQCASGAFPGGQLVVRSEGKLVLSEAIGVARGHRTVELESPVPVTSTTPFPAYSCGKPLAAVAIAMLEDRGKLDVDAPIAEVFPEFGQHGKERISTLDVLTHRSGISLPGLMSNVARWTDSDAMIRELTQARPRYPLGTLAYAPWEFGLILSEVVRRVDGRTLARFFAEEIATPLGLTGLRFGYAGRTPESIAHSYWLGKTKVVVAGVNVAQDFEATNNAREYFESLNPACSLITHADDLAKLYDFILAGGVVPGGDKLISGSILNRYTRRTYFGFDRSLRTFLAIGRGFAVGTLPPSVFGWWNTVECFGHGGAFCALAGADPRVGVSFAILTNGNRSIADYTRRFVPLSHMIRRATHLMPFQT